MEIFYNAGLFTWIVTYLWSVQHLTYECCQLKCVLDDIVFTTVKTMLSDCQHTILTDKH
jgi:hypothetical protein